MPFFTRCFSVLFLYCTFYIYLLTIYLGGKNINILAHSYYIMCIVILCKVVIIARKSCFFTTKHVQSVARENRQLSTLTLAFGLVKIPLGFPFYLSLLSYQTTIYVVVALSLARRIFVIVITLLLSLRISFF